MNWKIFSIILINVACITFPYNIIGCAEESDPYDEYTTFFRNDLSPAKEYRPFYYVNNNFLYDPLATDSATGLLCEEWARYCHNKTTTQQAFQFLCRFQSKDLTDLSAHIQSNHTGPDPTIRSSILGNGMTSYFLQSRDQEALNYIIFFKKIDETTLLVNDWNAPKRDSIQLDKLMAEARTGYTASKKSFIKTRYAYQVISLAFYNHHYAECIRFYDAMLNNNPSGGELTGLGLSFKAGALWRSGRRIEAAYDYSRAFSMSAAKKTSNYISFSWCVKHLSQSDRNQCLTLCRNKKESADLLSLFLLGSNAPELASLKKIAQLSSGSPVLEVLAIREINKIEQNYFSPTLRLQKGGKALYFTWWDQEEEQHHSDKWLAEAKELAEFYHTLSLDTTTRHKALFETGAAWLSYITKQYPQSAQYLDRAALLPATKKLKDQQAMTRLLITINEKPAIDTGFEAALLPSVQWLEKKAKADGKGMQEHYYNSWTNSLWQQFYRNLLSEILARRYHQQGDYHKEALCIGSGEKMIARPADQLGYDYYPGLTKEFVRNDLSTDGLLKLNRFLLSPHKTPWEKYLCDRFLVTRDEVTTTIAATHCRDYHFHEALQWLKKIKDPKMLALQRNPFGDLLQDNQDSLFAFDKGSFNKVRFISRMEELTNKVRQNKATPADLYILATGYYNMTYYGRAWETVKFFRSSIDGFFIPNEATPFQKEYYGCFTAERTFKSAMNASTDRNFKARCLFMMAKCSQKRVPRPSDEVNMTAEAWQKLDKKYWDQFMKNQHFPRLVGEFSNTTFYKEVFSTCSYLRDFVHQKP